MEKLEPLVRTPQGNFATGDSLLWLTDPSPETACIYDVDLNAVDPKEPWVRIRRTMVVQPNQYHGPAAIRVAHAMMQHPTLRRSVKGLNVAHYQSLDNLPEWMQGRIAVLNMTDGEWVQGIGKRWLTKEYALATNWSHSLNSIGRYYTLELNCEGCL